MVMIFDPDPLFQDFRRAEEKGVPRPGDRRDGKVYDYSESLVLAINVALATARPLLLRGHAGCGKSSVAYNVARVMGRRYYEKVISSRMEARDLQYRFDAVRRLGDAQVAAASGEAASATWRSYHPYIEPEVLWWIFDAASASRRGLAEGKRLFFEPAEDPVVFEPPVEAPPSRSVLLLDEIDKAEPDVPNNLLVALGSMEFPIEEIQLTVRLKEAEESRMAPEEMPLVVITTNEERQLPPAFLRRCVVYRFEPLDTEGLCRIAALCEGEHEGPLYETLATKMQELAAEKAGGGGRRGEVSIAEYLDAIRASKRLDVRATEDRLLEIIQRTIWKQPRRD